MDFGRLVAISVSDPYFPHSEALGRVCVFLSACLMKATASTAPNYLYTTRVCLEPILAGARMRRIMHRHHAQPSRTKHAALFMLDHEACLRCAGGLWFIFIFGQTSLDKYGEHGYVSKKRSRLAIMRLNALY